MRTFRWAGLLAVLCSLPVWAAEPPQTSAGISGGLPAIVAIEFVGNNVTREQILRQEMLVKEGDPADPSQIEQSRQAIMNLGLFESVLAEVLPWADGVALRVVVKEKYYILPVPKLNRDDQDNFTLGAEITVDNLGGYNQQLKLRYETEEAEAQAGDRKVGYLFSYRYPRIFGGPWQLQTEVLQETGWVDGLVGSVPTWLYKKQGRGANLLLTRWFDKTGPSQGWQSGGGLVWRRNVYDFVSCYPAVPLPCPAAGAYQDSTAVGISALLAYTKVADYLYSRSGLEYGYSGEYGSKTFGSDTRYTRHEIFWRHYYLFEGRAHENIETQAQIGLSSGDQFLGDQYAYALGGNKSMRGYESSAALGNAYVLINIQYLRPLFGYYPLRGVIFLDVGNVFPSTERVHLERVLWDVGVGLRFRLKSFVKIDLRLDVAYSPDLGETRTFLGTKEMF